MIFYEEKNFPNDIWKFQKERDSGNSGALERYFITGHFEEGSVRSTTLKQLDSLLKLYKILELKCQNRSRKETRKLRVTS